MPMQRHSALRIEHGGHGNMMTTPDLYSDRVVKLIPSAAEDCHLEGKALRIAVTRSCPFVGQLC